MKNRKRFMLIMAGLFILTSCQTIKTSTTKETDIAGPTIIQKPVVADLDVKEDKITASYEGASGLGVDFIKEGAVASALKIASADVLVEPRFEVTRSFRKISVVVTGYPATYKNFRPMELKDTLFIQPATAKTDKSSFGSFDSGQGRNKGKIALISGGTVAVLGGLFLAWLFIF